MTERAQPVDAVHKADLPGCPLFGRYWVYSASSSSFCIQRELDFVWGHRCDRVVRWVGGSGGVASLPSLPSRPLLTASVQVLSVPGRDCVSALAQYT